MHWFERFPIRSERPKRRKTALEELLIRIYHSSGGRFLVSVLLLALLFALNLLISLNRLSWFLTLCGIECIAFLAGMWIHYVWMQSHRK